MSNCRNKKCEETQKKGEKQKSKWIANKLAVLEVNIVNALRKHEETAHYSQRHLQYNLSEADKEPQHWQKRNPAKLILINVFLNLKTWYKLTDLVMYEPNIKLDKRAHL